MTKKAEQNEPTLSGAQAELLKVFASNGFPDALQRPKGIHQLNEVGVDVIAVLRAHTRAVSDDDPACFTKIDHLLSSIGVPLEQATITRPEYWSTEALARFNEVLQRTQEWKARAQPDADASRQPMTSDVSESRAITPAAGEENRELRRNPLRATRRRTAAALGSVTVALVAAWGALNLLQRDSRPDPVAATIERAKSLNVTYPQVAGGPARTWSDYTIAGGESGRPIAAQQMVMVTCKVHGFPVESGNDWWYLIASNPWRKMYFATADAFYNQTPTTGPLKGTPFSDPSVPDCP